MSALFRFNQAARRDPAVEAWLHERIDVIGGLAHQWFEQLRNCGDDIRELMHDGHATACVDDAAFAYVAAYKAHAAIGFYRGAALPDPHGLLEGKGKAMRHVKLRPEQEPSTSAVRALIDAAYRDMRALVAEGV